MSNFELPDENTKYTTQAAEVILRVIQNAGYDLNKISADAEAYVMAGGEHIAVSGGDKSDLVKEISRLVSLVEPVTSQE